MQNEGGKTVACHIKKPNKKSRVLYANRPEKVNISTNKKNLQKILKFYFTNSDC